MPGSDWTPQRRALAAKACRLLREMGYSYEEIVHHLADAEGNKQLQPWEAYAFANPGKSTAQIAAWKAKHHPDG